MDRRTALPEGTVLPFPGLSCRIDGYVGRGSNAIVYEASYPDAANSARRHRVLVKELFPLDVRGHIRRGEDGAVLTDPQAQELWQTHRLSFERGNDVHLQLLALRSDRIGGNLNTYALNGTLYTVLDDPGSRALKQRLAGKPAGDLRTAAGWCLRLLDCLEVFHRQEFLHLDISPDNVLLLGDGAEERVMLIDFNSVHSIAELRSGAALSLSAKEGFTAPEAQTGLLRSISFCTDLFSVAAVFYTLLTGSAPSLVQLNRKVPPDAQDSPLLSDAPSTVREQVRKILRRGLCALPEKRYPSCAAMKKDLTELTDRLAGLGVSHAALWEAGRKNVLRLVRRNPSLAYLEKEAELYPLRVTWEESGRSVFLKDFMAEAAACRDLPVLLEGAGGSGKSTALLRTVLSAPPIYSAGAPALIYIPLYAWREDGGTFILDQILKELRFDAKTRTLEDARHALTEQLNKPLLFKGQARPALLLLLDGLNEAPDDSSALLKEITALSRLPGLSIVVSGRVCPEGFPAEKAHLDLLTAQDVDQALSRRGLLTPDKKEMRELLRTPLMLSLFIQTALSRDTQMQCETEAQLVDAYLDALCDKAGQDGRQAQYQAEAAVRLVLPAIAREMQKQSAPPDDRHLLSPVTGCRRMIDKRTLSRVFPQWIGHGEELTGGAVSDETWYGRIVHDTLWQRLGLLVRDERGGWHIRHQILQDHLVRLDARNRSSVRKAHVRSGAVAAGLIVCAACALLLVRPAWFTALFPARWRIPEPPDMAVIAAAENREYDPADPHHEMLMGTLEAAQNGDAFYQYGMGVLYEDGAGVERDYETARQFYLLAASHGQPNAFQRLGIFYLHGFGVDVSADTAVAYFEKAASFGLTDAMLDLGRLYLDGELVRQSDTKALQYFQAAWDKGDEEAAYQLAGLYLSGRGVKQSDSRAIQLYQSALDAGYAPAAEALGDIYSDTTRSVWAPETAARYYRQAVDLGLEQAAEKLEALQGE